MNREKEGKRAKKNYRKSIEDPKGISNRKTKTVSSRYKFHFMSIEHIFKAAHVNIICEMKREIENGRKIYYLRCKKKKKKQLMYLFSIAFVIRLIYVSIGSS